MKEKCPKCGYPCEATKRSILDKASDGFTKSAEAMAGLVSTVGGLFGKDGQKVGKIVGDKLADKTPIPYFNAVKEVALGDNFSYLCPQCGYEWTVVVKGDTIKDESQHVSSNESESRLEREENIDMDQASISINELEYLGEFKACIREGGINESERRLLNKLRDRLGINEARGAELEDTAVSSKLLDEEIEYLQAYYEAKEEGELTNVERRLLNRLRGALKITEERAKEIERFVIN